jgi:serine/threonine protein kinase/Flp pilus assembly protein TadD
MALTASTRLGRYEIVTKLGAGGMGEVYRARDTQLERDVAIKVLTAALTQDALALARFQREARAVAALSHPSILTLHDIGTEQGTTYVVMELLEGQTLGTRLKQGPLDCRTALAIAVPVAEGLAVAHAKGIIHRDIKPENIFLTTDGGVKILDFGLVRREQKPVPAVGGLSATVGLETEPGMIMGTVAYMSPEQVRGQPADARSDVFSFGAMFHEMLIGWRPFDGPTAADTMAAILNNPPPTLSQSGRERPAALDRILMRCLEKNAALRFQSGRELAAALKSVVQDTAASDSGGQQQFLDTTLEHVSTPQGTTAPTAPSIAVLPFVNMSSDAENQYFSDGLAEELIAVLTKVKGLHVSSRTSSFAFKGKNEDVRKIGEQLNVRTVLEGSVRKSGNRLRIAAQLVNVADGYHLWSETYNRQMEDVFAIQDEIAQSIAKALQVILTEQDKRALENGAPCADVKAYEFYLRGRQFFHQFRRKGFEFAQQMFTRAIEIDANYARAYAGIADCHSLLYHNWEATEANLKKADEASQKALELGPNLAEAHVARGLYLSLRKQFAEARREFETAIRLDPSLFEARYFFGRTCLREGKLQDAAEQFDQAARMRPDDYQSLSHLASIHNGLGRKAEALAASRHSLDVIEKHLALHPDDTRALYLGATVWTKLGESARAMEWADRAVAMNPEEPLTLYNVACVYALQGQVEPALDCLERAIKHGYAHKAWVLNDADLNSLRTHPRYLALVEKLANC